MYPFAIINSFGSKIERVYRDFAQRVNKKIFPMLHTVISNEREKSIVQRNDSADNANSSKLDRPGEGAGSRLSEGWTMGQFEVTVYDATNVLELLEEIRLTYGDYVDDALLTKIIAENIELLDGWSTSQLNRMIEMQSKDAINRVSTGGVDKPVVPLIPKKNVVSMQNIPLANNSQRLLQNDAYSKYFFDVEEIINNGIIDGLKPDEITKQILDKVDMNAKRARFWAEDQASIFQAEQTRLKAIREGQTHYKWIAGASARPSHAVHNGQVYSWNVGVNNLSRPGARHPGEDYRCHCRIGLATAEEIAKAGSPPPREPQSTAGLIENYKGSEAVKAEKGKAFIAGKSIVKSEPRDSRPITAFELLTQEGIRLAVVEQNLPAKKSSVLIAQSPLEIGVVYNSKGELINAINGTRNAVTDLDVFASDLINGTFLHNHPGGTSFSLEDIVFFEKSKVKTMVVATKDYRYTIDRGNKIIDAKKILKEFRNAYQEAHAKAKQLVRQGLLDRKNLLSETVNMQWKISSEKLGIQYTREAL